MDFRSDTTTRPSPEMRQAMSEANVGDDVYGEDPTILQLQRDAAAMTGMEAALFVCSGTMGNLLAVLAHCSERGSEVVVGNESHVYVYEAGGMSVLGGVPFNVLQNKDNGELDLDELAAAIRPEDQHAAMTRCICIETTHNRCGGAVLSLDYLQRLKALARSKHLKLHLDGARVFNAATALGVPVSDITSCVDTVQFCLSKGLGAPVGSIVAGPADFIAKVHRLRKMVGGGMRQAGVLAAPGLIALHKMTKRLHEDHENARTLATGIAKLPWAHIDLAAVQTNIVCFRVASPLSPQSLLAHLAANRIQALAFRGGVRMVTHLDVSAEDVSKALAVLSSAQAQANGLQESAKVQAAPSADGAVANGHSNKPAYKEY